MDGYEITLRDQTKISFICAGKNSALYIDDVTITVEDNKVNIQAPAGTDIIVDKIQAKKIETMACGKGKAEGTETDKIGILRTCINCQGKRYCVTDSCANTPCGWICDGKGVGTC